MVLGYHLIFAAYGFWLPNDPRGSWSEAVIAWDLFRAGGPATKVNVRHSVASMPHDREKRSNAKNALKFPPIQFTGKQALSIANGFRLAITERAYPVHACSILRDHAHLIIGRIDRDISIDGGHLKARATQQLNIDGFHPFAKTRYPDHTPWAAKFWKVFIDSPQWMLAAVSYVERNPEKEGLPRQRWSFVQPCAG